MTNKYNMIDSCEVCGSKDLSFVLDLGLHPMCDDLVVVGDARVCQEYPIEILFCKKCITAHQRYQVPKKDLFPKSYHYRSRFTLDVLNGMAELVHSCADRFGCLADKKVLDIGCNDGSLLGFFQQNGAITIGIEPTDAYVDAEGKGHAIYNDYLSDSVANKIVSKYGQPDFITFTNVFAHIENLHQMLASLKLLIGSQTVIVIENHYLGAIFSGNQFDTFYHEHPRTYSYTSFNEIANSLEMKLLEVEFPARYGGNIRVFLGQDEHVINKGERSIDCQALSIKEGHFFEDFSILRANVESWQRVKKDFLLDLVQEYGPLRAKAFPGRAAILIKLLELDESLISAVYEKPGSLKIGHYIPGTRIPIVSDNELFAQSDQTLPLLNLAWHIPQEIRNYLAEHNYMGQVIDIIDPKEFVKRL